MEWDAHPFNLVKYTQPNPTRHPTHLDLLGHDAQHLVHHHQPHHHGALRIERLRGGRGHVRRRRGRGPLLDGGGLRAVEHALAPHGGLGLVGHLPALRALGLVLHDDRDALHQQRLLADAREEELDLQLPHLDVGEEGGVDAVAEAARVLLRGLPLERGEVRVAHVGGRLAPHEVHHDGRGRADDVHLLHACLVLQRHCVCFGVRVRWSVKSSRGRAMHPPATLI